MKWPLAVVAARKLIDSFERSVCFRGACAIRMNDEGPQGAKHAPICAVPRSRGLGQASEDHRRRQRSRSNAFGLSGTRSSPRHRQWLIASSRNEWNDFTSWIRSPHIAGPLAHEHISARTDFAVTEIGPKWDLKGHLGNRSHPYSAARRSPLRDRSDLPVHQ